MRQVSESPTWWGRYTDGAGKEHQVKLSKSKEIARRMLAKLYRLCRGVGISTTNAYLTAIKGFMRYLGPAKENRAPSDPLA